MTIRKFSMDNDWKWSSNPLYNQQSDDITFKLESEVRNRPVPYSRRSRRPEDLEWKEVFEFQTSFRKAYSMSAPGFLRKLGLPESFASMLYSDISSTKDCTPEMRQ